MSNTTEEQIVAHLRKLLNERDEQSRKRIADLERDLAHSRVMERQLAAELEHLRSELANQLLAIEIATTAAAQGIDVSTNDSVGKTETIVQAEAPATETNRCEWHGLRRCRCEADGKGRRHGRAPNHLGTLTVTPSPG